MGIAKTPAELAEEFLKTAHLYQLGKLPTEASHPQTQKLSDLAQTDLLQAMKLLRLVDLQALEKLRYALKSLESLHLAISDTLNGGGRIFLCGCGATGRLSLSLEHLWRKQHQGRLRDQVVGFMAGGDVALVHSLEGFEDFPEYGAEHLRQLGFSTNDLLISCTEGGETPYVIGATEAALEISTRAPFFLYCNPREDLLRLVERSRRVLENPLIEDICLFVGPMALSGSTRMQASTVLMLAVGMALLDWRSSTELSVQLTSFLDFYRHLDLEELSLLTESEAQTYQDGGRVIYSVSESAMTIFTDTTERAPTFSLAPFNNQAYPRPHHSLSYVMIPEAKTANEGWQKLLAREPRVLNWPDRNSKTTLDYLMGFDFSKGAQGYREKALPGLNHYVFEIKVTELKFIFHFRGREVQIPRSGFTPLWDEILLKMLLNIHSTLVMGRIGRYRGNLMTWVQPTNGKLVDRASRYVIELARQLDGESIPYEQAVRAIYEAMAITSPSEPVVLNALKWLKDYRAISKA